VDFEHRIEAILGDQGTNPEERALLELGPSREGAYFKPVNSVNVTVASMPGHTHSWVLPACSARCRRWMPMRLAPSPGSASTSASRTCSRAGRRSRCIFDALIGNQDRSRSNLLFDASRDELALIDHGFAFMRDTDVVNVSVLVDWRRRAGLSALTDTEQDALERILGDAALLGVRRYLEPDRADALERRAVRMRETGTVA
jgi:hypothetical protein